MPAGTLRERARQAAAQLAKQPLGALAMTKRMMRDAAALAACIDEESARFHERLRSAEAREAFTAFAERRPPDFSKLEG